MAGNGNRGHSSLSRRLKLRLEFVLAAFDTARSVGERGEFAHPDWRLGQIRCQKRRNLPAHDRKLRQPGHGFEKHSSGQPSLAR